MLKLKMMFFNLIIFQIIYFTFKADTFFTRTPEINVILSNCEVIHKHGQ